MARPKYYKSRGFVTPIMIALRVEGVSKQYRLYDSPNDRLKEMLTRGRWRRHREFWALKDINLEIEPGTTTGIVGPNGSGKSTLLQIITGTLEPTHGSVSHEGRVAALLELGAGFNPDFTGVENIFMNASLLGFSRKETEALLTEIEKFAEIGSFIQQPVKTYSSGMYVRLAFSVAISASPEILIVDEALAVGDAVFQHRCMRRIKEMQESGVTILFVSHDPNAIRALCSRAVLLNAGQVVADGPPSDVLNRYQKIIMAREEAYDGNQQMYPTIVARNGACSNSESLPKPSYSYRHGNGSAEIVAVELLNAACKAVELAETGELLLVRARVLCHADVDAPLELLLAHTLERRPPRRGGGGGDCRGARHPKLPLPRHRPLLRARHAGGGRGHPPPHHRRARLDRRLAGPHAEDGGVGLECLRHPVRGQACVLLRLPGLFPGRPLDLGPRGPQRGALGTRGHRRG